MAILLIFAKIISKMKYTNYIINGKIFNFDTIRSRNTSINTLLTLIKIPAVFMGVGMLSGILPLTILIDSYRNTKCRLIHFKRNHFRF